MLQWFCHVYTIIALLADAVRLDEADAAIERDVLGHQRVRIEVNGVIAASTGLSFGEFDQCATMALALAFRQDGDVVEQQTRLRFLQNEEADDATCVLQHPGLAVSDAPRVIVQHRAGRFADARDVVRVRGLDDTARGTRIMMMGDANHDGIDTTASYAARSRTASVDASSPTAWARRSSRRITLSPANTPLSSSSRRMSRLPASRSPVPASRSGVPADNV